MKKNKKACYTPAAVKNGRVSKAHKTYSNPGPAKAGAVRLAKAAGGKPVVVRSNKSSKDATFHKDGTVTFWSVIEHSWRPRVRVSAIWRHPYTERESFSDREWNRIGRLAGAKSSDHDARPNPKNPLRQVVLGHTVTWSPKKGGYVIDAYQMVFPKVKELRDYLKEHVTKELRHR